MERTAATRIFRDYEALQFCLGVRIRNVSFAGVAE